MATETAFNLVRMEVGGHPVLFVYGEVDVLTAPRVHEALSSIIAEGHTSVLVDMANVTFIDSSGLTALVVAHRHLDDAGGELRLVSVPESVGKVFAIAGLDERFKIFPSVEHATGGVAPVE
ncbi:MAG TPA: STAS domain-containing protein [Acidimicrobiales bacterium]|jgi:anti-sigma B factor antagonist|nr:STAS domain-containing protein [Acidimicrobiales bacterium]